MAKPLLAVNLRRILLRLLPSLEIKLPSEQLRISNHIQMIRDNLWAVNAIIMDANLRAVKKPKMEKWLLDVNATIIDVENILGVFQDYHQQLKEQQKQKVTTSLNFSLSSRRLAFLDELKQVAQSLNFLLSRAIAFGLQIDMIDSIDPNQDDYYSILQQKVVGRDDDINNILQIIFQLREGQQLSSDINDDIPFVVAITGEARTGKSTLARMVYHHPLVCEFFKHRIWVDVSNCVLYSFDHRQIARECARHLTGRILSDINILSLIPTLLPKTRYLFVLDGFSSITMENKDKWEILRKNLLSFGAPGSRAIITCHSYPIARNDQMVYSDKDYKLEGISRDAWTKLFLGYALLKTQFDQAKQNSSSIGKKNLANKLFDMERYHYPIRAKNLGSISRHTKLSSDDFQKEYNEYDKLMTVHYATHEFTQIILYAVLFQPLPLSFTSGCFDMLMTESTFDYSRNSQQQFQENVLTWISKLSQIDEKFDALLFDIKKSVYHFRKKDGQIFRIPQQCLYLCILVDSDTSTFLTELEPKIANNLRMLMLYTIQEDTIQEDMDLQLEKHQKASSILKSLMKNLIILSITNIGIQQLPDTFSMLLRLRYLSISEKEIEELPNSICNLYNLCVLCLSHCKKLLKLPEEIHKLIKLQILRLAYCTRLQKLPKSITSLVNLQVLDVEACHWLKEMPEYLESFKSLISLNMIGCVSLDHIAFKGFNFPNIEVLSGCTFLELIYLQNIVQLDIRHLERTQISISSPIMYQQLENLVLHWEWWNTDVSELEQQRSYAILNKVLLTTPHLKSLDIISYFGTKFPNWTTLDDFKLLVEIRLVNMKKCENLPLLCRVRSLAILEISGMYSLTYVGNKISSDEHTFPKLVKLTLSRMLNLEEWNLKCPSLQQLVLINCPKLLRLFGFELKNKLSIWLQSELLVQSSSSFQSIIKIIEELEIVGCHKMRELPEDIKNCMHLQKLLIMRCSKLVSLPDWLHEMPSLQQISVLGCTKISYVSEKFKQRLKNHIIIQGCPRLQAIW